MAIALRGLLVGGLLFGMAACGTTYKPGHEAEQRVALDAARTIVQTGANGYWVPIENGVRVERIDVLYSGLRIVPRSGQPLLCRFREFDPVMDTHHTRLGYSVALKGCNIKSKHATEMYLGYDFRVEQARQLADAIHVLKRRYLVLSGPDTQMQNEVFEAAARQYRAAPMPVVLPEAVLTLERQAEVAAIENRVDDAIELYTSILDRVPAWPDGYYRRGTLNGEIGEYAAAIRDLNKYLRLEPDAQDARTAKTLVYQWRSKLLAVKSGR